MTTSAGCERVENKHYDWNGLRRGPAEFVLIQHTISGRGHMRFEDDRHILGPGDTMLLRFPHRNRYWLQQGDVWEFFWLCLNGREVLRIFRQMMAGSGPVVRLPEVAVNRLAGLCTTVVDGEAATPARASAIA
ncbi:MAG: AraC family ligand binding domain-containing protein, partial [Pseudomonadota bacterium]